MLESLFDGSLRFRLREQLLMPVVSRLGDTDFVFQCASTVDVSRARTLATKEAGTIAWIRETLRPGDVFFDIGANIGLYSLVAAEHVGSNGLVVAFEPHIVNFCSLMNNIVANGFGDRVRAVSCALHDQEGMFDFNYNNLASGTSMSQLGSTRDGDEREFRPAFQEQKIGVPLDTLVSEWGLPAPTSIKLDVDGNELRILRGMRRLLAGSSRPRTLQVEINARYREELFAFMSACGYECYRKHHTTHGQTLISAGADPELIPYNALFQPVR